MLTKIKKSLYIMILIILSILSSCGNQEDKDINNIKQTDLHGKKMKSVGGEVIEKGTKDSISSFTKTGELKAPIKPNFN